MKCYVVVTFYKFVSLPDFMAMREPLLAIMNNQGIKGTIILANEGINGSFCAERASLDYLIGVIHQYPELANLEFKETISDFNPFDKAKVKLRNEIVTLGVPNLNPAENTGIHLKPEEWNQLLTEPDVVVVDTRNHYEVELGTFNNALNPNTENFRDFPDYVAHELMDKKDKKIAMFCTGGIRCEKSTAYLKQLGFNEVYQLEGGILNYLKVTPKNESQWQGTCFVFDERVALDNQLDNLEKGSIDTDWKNNFKKKVAVDVKS